MKHVYLITAVSLIVVSSIVTQRAFASEPCPTGGYIHYGPSRQYIPCYLVSQLQGYAHQLNKGELSRIWSSVTGASMSGAQRMMIQKFFKRFDDKLRIS